MAGKVYDVKQRTYLYALEMIRFLETLPRDYISRTLGQQLLRAATSIGANVAEGQASSSRRDFANFYNHALKSGNETKFWLGLLKDSGKVSAEHITPLLMEVHELSNILGASLLTLKARK
jgi:four helix bundle protein